jgi:hypothetical protein
MGKKDNPAAGDNRCGAGDNFDASTTDSPSIWSEKKEIVFIHVLPNGTEERTQHRPVGRPALRVEIEDGYEYTNTWNAPSDPDGWPVFVEPPGKGWHLYDRHFSYARWSRRVRKVVS